MDIAILVGRNVRALRRDAGVTQEELGFQAGFERSYISDLERGTRNPTIRALEKLASALGVPAKRLLEDV